MSTATLPQANYFNRTYQFANEWMLTGHSRALERTGFLLSGPGIRIMLDAGIDVHNFSPLDAILVTHTHIDHCNALPMLIRHTREGKPTHIYSPYSTINRLRQFAQLSFAIKVDEGNEVPQRYCTPCAITSGNGEASYTPFEEKTLHWHAVLPGLQLPLLAGKGKKQHFTINTVELFHTCTAVGYIISQQRSKLRPELKNDDDRTTAANVKAARQRGEEINIIYDNPIVAFICDTDIRALTTGPHAMQILTCPVVIVECTYLEENMKSEADRRGHITWSDLLPLVINTPNQITFILIHFSLRYSDDEVVDFFRTSSGACMREIRDDSNEVPKVVLWLDSGIVRLVLDEHA